MAALLNSVGLVLSLVGVILLFRYGMPFRTRTGGVSRLVIGEPNAEVVKSEARFAVLGWIGLALICVGTGLQMAANWV